MRWEPRKNVWFPGSLSVYLDDRILVRAEKSNAPCAVGGRDDVHSNGIGRGGKGPVLDAVGACIARSVVDGAVGHII